MKNPPDLYPPLGPRSSITPDGRLSIVGFSTQSAEFYCPCGGAVVTRYYQRYDGATGRKILCSRCARRSHSPESSAIIDFYVLGDSYERRGFGGFCSNCTGRTEVLLFRVKRYPDKRRFFGYTVFCFDCRITGSLYTSVENAIMGYAGVNHASA